MMSFATLKPVPVDLIVCVSTEFEGALLRPHVPLLVTGVGAVNAASALTRYFEREGAHSVISCGIGGAYPHAFADAGPGSVFCAETECYGDLGATDASGAFLDMQDLGFPVLPKGPIYNVIPLQLFPGPRRVRFVTMNTCSGSDATACALESRTGGAVESMEGAAIAHVCMLYGIPCGEIRGISNRAGNRDRGSWRVKEAAVAAQESLLAWVRER